MAKSEKELIKKSIKRLKGSFIGFMISGALAMFTGIGLMFLSIKTQTASGMEVGVFGFGALLIIIAQLLSVRLLKLEKKLSNYRKDINDKRDDHYYRMVCVYAKRCNVEKANSFCHLIKDTEKRSIMVGFIMNETLSKNNNEQFNTKLGWVLDNMKKYKM